MFPSEQAAVYLPSSLDASWIAPSSWLLLGLSNSPIRPSSRPGSSDSLLLEPVDVLVSVRWVYLDEHLGVLVDVEYIPPRHPAFPEQWFDLWV